MAERGTGRVTPGRTAPKGGIRDAAKEEAPPRRTPQAPAKEPAAKEPQTKGPPTEEPPAPKAAEAPVHPGRLRSGVRRLDQLLGGGVPQGSFLLLYGAPFLGKEVLARRFIAAALEDGTPSVLVTTNGTADEMRRDIGRLDGSLETHESDGLLRFVDAYSRPVGADNKAPHVSYVDGPMDLNGISVAVNDIQKRLVADHQEHLLLVDSASTIVAYSNAQTAFRFLQVLLGKARRVGATTVVLLDEGMHTQAEVQMFKHLMSGSIDLQERAGKTQMRVLGMGQTEGLGWVDYRFQGDRFDVTGSFAAGRIR